MSEVVEAADAGQPVFEVKVRLTDVRAEVRVNDIPVMRVNAGHVVTEFDVNPQVWTGENTLSLIVRPRRRGEDFGKNAAGSVSFQRRAGKDATEAQEIAAVLFSGPAADVASGFEPSPGYSTTTPPDVERGPVRANQRFELATPFEPWTWVDAPELRATEALRAELYDAYKRVHAMMRARDIDGLVRATLHQARDYQQAYYLASEEEAIRLLGIPMTFADGSVEVEDFPEAALHLELLGGGKLAQLVDDEGQSPLTLRIASANMTGRFVAVFCRTAGGLRIAC